jgi:hypothetical protein
MSHVQHTLVWRLTPAMARADEGYGVAVRASVRNSHDFVSDAGHVLEAT